MAAPLIAVVNDDTDFLELMEEVLSEEGYRTVIVKEGKKAYHILKKKRPDLVVIDIRLSDPETGFVLVDLLRLDPTTAGLPIIVCSTNSQLMEANHDHLEARGCVVLLKPFGIEELYQKVAAFLPPSKDRSAVG